MQGEQIHIEGQVQGVGFRPFVHNLAVRLGVCGRVWNDAEGVKIDAFAPQETLNRFVDALTQQSPPMALIDRLQRRELVGDAPSGFTIVSSGAGEVRLSVTPDAAVCADCLQELFDPSDRRYLHPFINCTHCGPRYSLIARLPYDRPNTSMAAFELCGCCMTEYRDPGDRRFHAQPTCCPACGPQLALHDAQGLVACADPITIVAKELRAGKIVAVKGLGGFHLVCDARNADAVARLRERKRRDEKPFAVMGLNAASLGSLVKLDEGSEARLRASDAPIVVLPNAQQLAGIAPGLGRTGVMLPHTPIHYRLFHELLGRPAGYQWLQDQQSPLLVMTSANRSGEPLITDDGEALEKLIGIADLWLGHNRDVLTRVDDSVYLGGRGLPVLVRRGRGLAPRLLALSHAGPATLAMGSYLKNCFGLSQGRRAYLSQYVGDLDNPDNCRALEQQVDHLKGLMVIEPEQIVVDCHPDTFGYQLGQRLASEWQLPLLEVQHHHAHIAAVLAERQLDEPVLGVALDGLGLGDDGHLWGGELLRVEQAAAERLGHLRPIALPGGDRASREPWRMGAAVLHLLGRGGEIATRFADQPAAAVVAQMLARGTNCPVTSSAGRWFDAAAGLLAIKPLTAYEAQAAMMLEALAEPLLSGQTAGVNDPMLPIVGEGNQLDLLPLLATLIGETDAARGAARFHQQLAASLAHWIDTTAQREQLSHVVLSGGCFLNQLLRSMLTQQLQAQGYQVHSSELVPCNDGAIALGQIWVAHRMAKRN